MRLIDADALDMAFTNLRFNQDMSLAHWGDRKNWCLFGHEVEKLIHDAPTIGGWISVKDNPPEKEEDVIIYGKYIGSSGSVYPVMLITDIGEFVCSGYVPITWMPLPEPPMEDNK